MNNLNKNNKAQSIGKFLDKHMGKITVCVMATMMICSTVFASATSNADTLWNTLATLIQTWVTRLGGVVIFIGGIMFALGWKSDDAEQKSRGVSTIIAGAMVTAIAAIAGTFFA